MQTMWSNAIAGCSSFPISELNIILVILQYNRMRNYYLFKNIIYRAARTLQFGNYLEYNLTSV